MNKTDLAMSEFTAKLIIEETTALMDNFKDAQAVVDCAARVMAKYGVNIIFCIRENEGEFEITALNLEHEQ